MKGGTIVLLGGAEIRTGAWMIRGTIISLTPLRLLPTFAYACTYNPTFLRLYARHLEALGLPIPHGPDGCLPALHGRHVRPGEGGDPRVAAPGGSRAEPSPSLSRLFSVPRSRPVDLEDEITQCASGQTLFTVDMTS